MGEVCIIDFNGKAMPGGFDIAYWATWYAKDQVVRFGGDWHMIPDMPSKAIPTEDAVHEWVREHMKGLTL